MRRLGTLSRVSQGKGIVSIDDDIPTISEAVVDETLTEVGNVVDVIGPIDDPYAVIDPADERHLADLLDAKLYLRKS